MFGYSDQLATGSDRLTNAARAYASTGEKHYYEMFQQEDSPEYVSAKASIMDPIAECSNLYNCDPAAGELLEQHRDEFRTFFTPETFETFEKQIGNFAFADAMNVLQEAAKQKGVQL